MCKNVPIVHCIVGVAPLSRESYQMCANDVYPIIAACGQGNAADGPHPATGGARENNQSSAQQTNVAPVNPKENNCVDLLPCAACAAEASAQSQSGASTPTAINPVSTPSGAWQFWTTYLLAKSSINKESCLRVSGQSIRRELVQR